MLENSDVFRNETSGNSAKQFVGYVKVLTLRTATPIKNSALPGYTVHVKQLSGTGEVSVACEEQSETGSISGLNGKNYMRERRSRNDMKTTLLYFGLIGRMK